MRWGKFRDYYRLAVKAVKSIKTWQLVVLLLFGTIASTLLLRVNNLNMMDLRKAVVDADQKGDQKILQDSVNELGRYVAGHMNTDLGEFYLTGSYERARELAMQEAQGEADPNSQLYQQASVQCQTERFSVAGGYVQCVLNKVSELGGPSALESELKLPRYEVYKLSFASPFWSPDLAGFAVALTALILLWIIARIIGVISLNLFLKKRFTSI